MSGDPVLREAISARITALQVAQHSLADQPEDAVAAIRRIAQALKNSDLIRSHPSLSSTVGSLLRARRTDTVEKLTTSLIEALRSASTDRGVKPSVLLVDDDRLLGAICRDALQESGFQVTIAETLRQATDALASQPISLAILDLILPDGDGRSLLLSMRENPRTAALPVFVMTAKSGSQAMTECFALGADAFFEKPVKAEALVEAVEKRLSVPHTEDHTRDPLTGALTRASLIDSYQQVQSSEPDVPVSVVLVATDHLADALRDLGSDVVEDALRTMAERLANALTAAALIGRWSGSELLCVLPRCSDAEAARLVQAAFDNPDSLPVSFSAGVTESTSASPLDEVAADAASHLATARMLGGNRAIWSNADVVAPTRSVLFVEDDDVIASLVTHRLKRDGFDVLHTTDGVAAVQALADTRFSMAILETRTPGLDGFTVLERLREQPALRRTPVIMLSSMGNEQDVVKCFQLGADDYMLKPFSPVELLARVHRLLARQ